jgi:hypothetical protein
LENKDQNAKAAVMAAFFCLSINISAEVHQKTLPGIREPEQGLS